MLNTTSRRPKGGFTLVEVMVALGIVAGSMILLLSANRNALQRSLRAQDQIRLEHAAESKFDEVLCGSETSQNGSFEGMPGCTWAIQQEPAEIEGLGNLQKVTITVSNPSKGTITKTALHYLALRTNGPAKGSVK